jgi:hypothetical protein
MGSGLIPGIYCVLCSKPVDLNIHLCADENGKAVHDGCYINRIAKPEPGRMWKSLRFRWQESRFRLEDMQGE